MKRPSFQFYPGDYLRDAAVRALSLEARGLWVDMLCLMHQAPRRGYLELAPGVPIDDSKLARMVGDSVNRISNLLDEMRLTGVFSEEGGVIFSRRMVRDERRAEINTENGRKGGNPQIKAYSVNRNTTKHPTEPPTTPVASSSTSSSSSKHTPPTPSTHVEGSESGIPIEGRNGLFAVEDIAAPKPVEKQKRERFVKPTVEEVREYCDQRKLEQGWSIDPVLFWNHYESNGWKVGGRAPMKSWRASVITWERNETAKRKDTPAPTAPQSYLPEYPAPEKRGHDPKAYEIDFWKEGGWE